MKNYVIICKEFNTQLTKIGTKRINDIKRSFRFKNKTFSIDISHPLFQKKNKRFYFYDIDHGPIELMKTDHIIDPDFYDDIFANHTLRELANQTGKSNSIFNMGIIGAIILIALGIFGGIILGQFIDFASLGSGAIVYG